MAFHFLVSVEVCNDFMNLKDYCSSDVQQHPGMIVKIK